MLSCQECQKYLMAFLDQSLDVKESLDVEEHLQSCTPCMHWVEAERTLRAFVRHQATTPPLPAELKRRIIHRAMQSSRPQSWWSRFGLGGHLRDFAIGVAAVAAVFVFLFGPRFFSSPGEEELQELVREASMTYDTYITQRVPPEVVSADDTVVTRWLTTRIGYPLKVPGITDKSAKLLGGRLCRLLNRKVAALMYRRGEANVLLFAFKSGPTPLPMKHRLPVHGHLFYVQNVAGRPVAMWQHGNMTYSMVGDLHQNELLHLATSLEYH